MTPPPSQPPPAPPESPPGAPGSPASPGISDSTNSTDSTDATDATDSPAAPATAPGPHLTRSPRQKVFAGVCGGLGRYCDVDPVIFRIVVGVLSVTGGIGLIFYGFAWLLIPQEGEEENEGRRLLSGRVDGASLIAVLLALIGCGLFLSMVGNGGTLGFAAMLSIAVAGSAVWSHRRRGATPAGGPLDPATAHAVAEAPPETKAPPSPGGPSWWRDPIVKDGTTGPVGGDYLWGPEGVADNPWPGQDAPAPSRPLGPPGPRGIGGAVLLLALIAGGLGTGLSWDTQPLGTSLQIGLSAALAVFGAGLAVSAFLGRTGLGTLFLAVVTGGLLAASASIPKDITTEWGRETWTPASYSVVQPRYQLGSGVGTLDLGGLAVPAGRTVRTHAEVGAGQLKVVVPRGATVVVRAEAGLGDLRLPGRPPNDVDISLGNKQTSTLAPRAGADPAGRVVLDVYVGFGQVEVTRATS
ncbi:PspC domain-containing protein [Streptomyces sp. NPDC006638]|uniref:PspC domain-containing protein n=1 Tax=Streptomyces sp. NPDC006638 TaxID=3157183 RepID=UPI0033ABCD2C